jgi:hypothetical protein
MNNPLDTNEFKHYLKFISLGRTDLYEIAEPIGFDKANFVLKQESKRYARSISYGAVDRLTFIDAYGIATTEPRIVNPQGDESYHLDYGLQWLLSIYKDYGFQAKVEYILEKNGVQFSGGMLDFTDKDITDGYTYVSAKLIQKNKVANLKRRLDDKFNVFSDKNVNQETITPAPSLDFLLKATPITNTSVWDLNQSKNLVAGVNAFQYSNYSANILQSAIRNTLTFFEQGIGGSFNDALNNFRVIQAQDDLSNITIKKDLDFTFNYSTGGSGSSSSIATMSLFLRVFEYPREIGDTDYYQATLFTKTITGNSNVTFTLPSTIEHTIPLVPRGYSVSLVWFLNWQTAHIGNTSWVINEDKTTITATSTAIDTVVKGVRWIDVIKQASKFTDALPITSTDLDSGGADYNNVCFNRRMISQNVTKFNLETKKAFESVFEINQDYEPDENGIFIGHHKEYYTNTEIGNFQIIPSEDFSIEENDRCQINKFNYGYKSFEQDRSANDTSQGIHTDAQFTFLNDNVENVKEVKNEFIRDPLLIQNIVNLEVDKPLTSTEEDDKVMIVEVVPLAPSSFASWSARLLMRIVEGKLEILNRDSEGENNDAVINWLVLGFTVGASFQITNGENVGNYTVDSITQSVVTLTPVAFTPTFNGDALITVKYFYTGVLWTNRTNEGFAEILNLNTSRFGNLAYSIKRNLLRFGEYMKSCLLYTRRDIPNAYFKSNGECATRLDGESSLLVEDATIDFDSLPNPLTTAKIYNLTCVAEFNEVLNVLEAYKVSRGFIRAYDSYGRVIKGYIQQLDHTWATNELKLTLEERFETEFLTLTYADGVLTVNDAVYELGGNSNWWIAENDYFKFFDVNSKPLCNFYKYNFISLNGSTFETKSELLTALLAL